MDALRERCTSPPPRLRRDDQLPLTHVGVKAWRQHSGGRGASRGSRTSRSAGRLRHGAMRVLLALLAVLVTVRVAHHLFGSPEPQLEDLMRLYGDALAPGGGAANATGGSSSGSAGAAQQPKLIPRIIHQTHAGGNAAPVPTALLPYMASWRRLNPGWDVRLYDDQVRGSNSRVGKRCCTCSMCASLGGVHRWWAVANKARAGNRRSTS